jgi:hypothetical protein
MPQIFKYWDIGVSSISSLKRTGVAAIVALMMQSSFAWGNLSLEDYKAAKKDPKQSVSLRSYIYGVGHGYFIFNVWNLTEGQKPMFCSPEHFALNGDNLFQLIDDFLQRHGASIDKAFEVEYIL